MNIKNNVLWVFGDSFCTVWPTLVLDKLQLTHSSERKAIKVYNFGQASSDVESVMDNWLMHIPLMKPEDGVVVCTTDATRCRYPLKIEHRYTHPMFQPTQPDVLVNYEFAPQGWDVVEDQEKPRSFQVLPTLEHPFLDVKEFQQFHHRNLLLHDADSRHMHLAKLWDALYEITPCEKKFLFTWSDYKEHLFSKYVHTKTWLTENVFDGYWETSSAEHARTWGAQGRQGDLHWSSDCETMMADYIITQFNIE